jgi:hypothetical protein
MVATGNFKTEAPPSKLAPAGHCKILTSINVTPVCHHTPSMMHFQTRQMRSQATQYIYLHSEAATEPASDKSIKTSDFTGEAEDTYSAVCDGSTAYSATTETSFFTEDTDFSTHNTIWTITYVAYYTGTPTTGYKPYMTLTFYKRDTSNNDTLLFSKDIDLGTLSNEATATITNETGSVTTSDRLRIIVTMHERAPT